MKIDINTAKFIILWYDNFGENQASLQRNGMAAIPKRANRKQNKQRYLNMGSWHKG